MENPIKIDDLGYHYFRKHPYNWVVCNPLYTANNKGFGHSSLVYWEPNMEAENDEFQTSMDIFDILIYNRENMAWFIIRGTRDRENRFDKLHSIAPINVGVNRFESLPSHRKTAEGASHVLQTMFVRDL